jgi:predicted MarR family transcription regulator
MTAPADAKRSPAARESRHLAASVEAAALLQLEFSSMRAREAFAAWVTEVHERSGGTPLPVGDVLLLHCIRLCGPPQTLAELRRYTNAHAVPRLQTGLRRLREAGMVDVVRTRGEREPRYSLTRRGEDATARYDDLRESALVRLCRREVGLVDEMTAASVLLERLVTLYRQAAQSLTDRDMFKRHDPYTEVP